MVLIIKPGSTPKFEFVFGFNECLRAIISLLIFGFICGLLLHDFWIYDANDFKSPLTPWVKNVTAKTTKFIPKSWEKSVKRKSNFNSIRVIKIHPLINIFYILIYMAQTFLKILNPHSERLLVSSATLFCKKWDISTFSMLVLNILII